MKKIGAQSEINRTVVTLCIYLVTFITIMSFLISLMNNKSNGLFGFTARIVVTCSMEPEIKQNSINIIKTCDISEIDVGDIVCYNYNQDIVHRVIKKSENDNGITVLNTQGDANSYADSVEVNDKMIVGKVVKTFNGISGVITKYSITPGEFDTASMTKSVVLYGLLIALAIWLVSLIISMIKIVIKALKNNDFFATEIEEYSNEIDELIVYKEVLSDLKNKNLKFEKDTKFSYILGSIAKIKVMIEMRNLHYVIKEYKRSINSCITIDNLGQVIDSNNKRERIEKEESTRFSHVMKYIEEFNNKHKRGKKKRR